MRLASSTLWPFGSAHQLAALVADFDEIAAFATVAQGPQAEEHRDACGKKPVDRIGDQVLAFERLRDQRLVDGFRQLRAFHQFDRLAGMGKAEQRQDRNQHGGDQQPGRGGGIPGPVTQPEMQAEAAMPPDDHQRDGLPDADIRRGDPQCPDHELVGILDPGQRMKDPRADDVFGDHERDQQAEHDLGGFPCGHDKAAPEIERAQHQRDMDQHGAVEHDGACRIAPDRQEPQPRRFRRIERDQVQRKIAEMHDDEDHHHQAGAEPRRSQRAARTSARGCRGPAGIAMSCWGCRGLFHPDSLAGSARVINGLVRSRPTLQMEPVPCLDAEASPRRQLCPSPLPSPRKNRERGRQRCGHLSSPRSYGERMPAGR